MIKFNLIQDALQAQAAHAVNLSLTARNWLVEYYIVEFEPNRLFYRLSATHLVLLANLKDSLKHWKKR